MNIWYATHNEFSVQVLEQFKQHLLHPKQHMLKILCGVFSLLFIVLITTKLIAVDNLGGPNNLFSTENSLCVAYQMFIKKNVGRQQAAGRRLKKNTNTKGNNWVQCKPAGLCTLEISFLVSQKSNAHQNTWRGKCKLKVASNAPK